MRYNVHNFCIMILVYLVYIDFWRCWQRTTILRQRTINNKLLKHISHATHKLNEGYNVYTTIIFMCVDNSSV